MKIIQIIALNKSIDRVRLDDVGALTENGEVYIYNVDKKEWEKLPELPNESDDKEVNII